MSEAARVLVVDDQYVARGFFEMSVGMSAHYELVGSLASAEQAVRFCRESPVDLVVMDVVMRHGLDGLACARTIKTNNHGVKVILVTSTAESTWVGQARKAGIEGFWFKEYAQLPLVEVMDRVMAGEHVYPDDIPNPRFGTASKTDLTAREQEVLRELTANLTNREIAERLGISVDTVRRHVQNMLNKTGYTSRLELAVNARLIGLVVHEDDMTRGA